LYPVKGIEEVEGRLTKPVKGVIAENDSTEIKRKTPDISATRKEWRI